VAGDVAERLEVSRSQLQPRIQMKADQEDRTRPHGGGRRPIYINRRPALGYSYSPKGQGDRNETGRAVMRRMLRMLDQNYNRLTAMRQKHFRAPNVDKKFKADFFMRLGRRRKEQQRKKDQDAEWQRWMRTEGGKLSLTEPLVFNGPKAKLTKEEDKLSEPSALRKLVPSEKVFTDEWMPKFPSYKETWPVDTQPGNWDNDSELNIFKIWKRPLLKYPYDIPHFRTKKIKRGRVL